MPEKGWQIPEEEVARRLDLRNGRALVCSVDPPGCVDIDDALHAKEIEPAPDGSRRFEVGVHIADVGHFIKAGTPIDTEAAARGTTVYLVNQRIDMVPKRLGEDLCSLHEKVDRLAFPHRHTHTYTYTYIHMHMHVHTGGQARLLRSVDDG